MRRETPAALALLALCASCAPDAPKSDEASQAASAMPAEPIFYIGQTRGAGPAVNRVDLPPGFHDPVVALGALSTAGSQPAHGRLLAASSSGFSWTVEEWAYLDGRHTTETVPYIVAERGHHVVSDGRQVEAGSVKLSHRKVPGAVITLRGRYSKPPLVFVTVTSRYEKTPARARVMRVTKSEIALLLEREEALRGRKSPATAEMVNFVVLERGASSKVPLADTVTGDSNATTIAHELGHEAKSRIALMALQGRSGGDTASVRITANRANKIRFFLQEEQSRDDETDHTRERVALVALPGPTGLATISKSRARAIGPEAVAFPGAMGNGAGTLGGRGGQVIRVTNTRDDRLPGSLRYALEFPVNNPDTRRIVVFDVSGTIEIDHSIDITKPYLTIAGQSAPGEGVQVWYRPRQSSPTPAIRIRTHDVIVRYLRVRFGPDPAGVTYPAGDPPCCHDALGIEGSVRDIIIDHSSFSWGRDETLDLWNTDENNTMRNITVQWSIVGEGIRRFDRGGRGTPVGGVGPITDISLVHNLYAHNFERNPVFSGVGTFHLVNNVIYNYKASATATQRRSGTPYYNIIGNYYVRGPDSSSTRRAVRLSWWEVVSGDRYTTQPLLYVEDNYSFHRTDLGDTSDASQWLVVARDDDVCCNEANRPLSICAYYIPDDQDCPIEDVYGAGPAPTHKQRPIALGPYQFPANIQQEPVQTVPARVLPAVGAALPARDRVDARLVNEVERCIQLGDAQRSQCDGRIAYSHSDIPDLAASPTTPPPLAPGPSVPDSDGDGLPDAWEQRCGLDPNDGSDSRVVDAGAQYARIEQFLNEVVAHGSVQGAIQHGKCGTCGSAAPSTSVGPEVLDHVSGNAGDLDGDGVHDDVVLRSALPDKRGRLQLCRDTAQHGFGRCQDLGDGPLTVPSNSLYAETARLRLRDMNGDQRTDIIVFANHGGYIKYAQPDGTFDTGQVFTDDPCAWAVGEIDDVDQDGQPDIVYFSHTWSSSSCQGYGTGNTQALNVVLNPGSGNPQLRSLSVPPTTSYLGDLKIGDVDGDGDIDIVAADLSTIFLLRNRQSQGAGAASFAAPVAVGTNSTDPFELEDVDGDGKLDMLVPDDDAPQVRYGNGDGTFGSPTTLPYVYPTLGNQASVYVTALDAVDLDGDGTMDLVVSEKVYQSTVSPDNTVTDTRSEMYIGWHRGIGNRRFAAPVLLHTIDRLHHLDELIVGHFDPGCEGDILAIPYSAKPTLLLNPANR